LRCFLSFFFQGRVVTETTTEYKEATDDSGFSDLVGSSNFPQISSNSSFGDAVVQSKPSAESSESSSDEEEDNEEKFQDEALKAHNDYRAKHGVELLKLDKKLCSYAKDWAAKLAKTDSFEHRQNQELGENLFVHGHPMPKPSVLEISQLIVGIQKSKNMNLAKNQLLWELVILHKLFGKQPKRWELPKQEQVEEK